VIKSVFATFVIKKFAKDIFSHLREVKKWGFSSNVCGCIEILGSSEFTREIDHSRRDFFGHW
jgi:hypothetical protein